MRSLATLAFLNPSSWETWSQRTEPAIQGLLAAVLARRTDMMILVSPAVTLMPPSAVEPSALVAVPDFLGDILAERV